MIQKINNNQDLLGQILKQNEQSQETGESFQSTLKSFLQDVNDSQIQTDEMTESFLKGDVTDLHQVTIAAEEARVSLELLLEMRNKLMESYQEIMRMQL
ncbi:MAG: flagellar hook-basal body complex protein FliE [Calditrichia bacterium]